MATFQTTPGSPVAAPAGLRLSAFNIPQVVIGLLGLAAGFLYYAAFRTHGPALVQALVGTALHDLGAAPSVLGQIFLSFPSFIHVFSFSLLTCGVAGRDVPGGRILFPAAWTGVNLLLELLQGVDYDTFLRITALSPWRMEALDRFVAGGVFDAHDVAAAVMGGGAAWAVSVFTGRKGEDHVA